MILKCPNPTCGAIIPGADPPTNSLSPIVMSYRCPKCQTRYTVTIEVTPQPEVTH